MPIEFMDCGATFDRTRRYRYTLWRSWVEQPERFVNFVMLNPSTADEKVLDPTVRRCVNFAKHWGYDGAYVTNIFALRSTDPKALYGHPDPVGPENNTNLLVTAEKCELVVAAWGVYGSHMERGKYVAELLQPWELKCFALTKNGHPRHPLYLRKDAQPVPFTVPATKVAV